MSEYQPRMYVGTRKGLFVFENRGDGLPWEIVGTAFLGVEVPMLLPDARDATLYAAVEHGHFGIKMQRSTDDGVSWEEIPAPAYPPKPDDVPEVMCPMRNIPIPWSLEKVWSLEAGGVDEPGALWCGTIPGGLFRSRNRGEDWQLVRSLWDRPERAKWSGGGYDYPGVHSIYVHPDDSAQVTVAVSIGGIWVTKDSGETWERRGEEGLRADYMPPELASDPDAQDPHRVVHCPAAPDHLWMQHHNGIFRSTDGGTRWQAIEDVSPSDFGFAVVVHPRDPESAWFVPGVKDEMRIPVDGRLVVTRTRDGGATFETLSRGLPQENAYDIVFRHGLDIDAGGNRLAFGSTTGSLWMSEDQGDSWDLLQTHLPPVYCVRFG